MIFREPHLTADDHAVIALLDRQKTRLRHLTQSAPRRWSGSLRRLSFARAMQGSNSIEGYHATLDNSVSAVDNEPPLDPKDETTLALFGYRDALTYIMQAAKDPFFELNKQFLKSLHFMMISYDMTKNPGQYRPGFIQVVNEKLGNVVYAAPEVDAVDELVGELVAYLKNEKTEAPVQVRAAMAHLNLTMIHPFSDGNGRMARAIQTFVLAREGILDPVFASIEEWLGANTDQYYAALAEVGQGKWNPQRDTLPWLRFCLKAHYQQAATIIRRNDEYALLFDVIEKIANTRKLNGRAITPLFEAALGLRLTNARYVSLAETEAHSATRDLKLLVDANLLIAEGEKRGRYYRRSTELAQARASARLSKKSEDPYELIKQEQGPRLPGL
jgi:Fic family protein